MNSLNQILEAFELRFQLFHLGLDLLLNSSFHLGLNDLLDRGLNAWRHILENVTVDGDRLVGLRANLALRTPGFTSLVRIHLDLSLGVCSIKFVKDTGGKCVLNE